MPASIAELRDGAHIVQFYSDDAAMVEVASRLVGTALVTGDSAIAIVTKAHREAIRRRLLERGLDIAIALRAGRYLTIDSEALTDDILESGVIRRDRFFRVIKDTLIAARSAADTR